MTLLASVGGRLHALGGGRFLHVGRDGASRELDGADAFVLDRCGCFESLDAHRRALQSAGMPAELAQASLARLHGMNLLVDFPALLAACATPEERPSDAPPRLVVRSWHRPGGVARLLASLRAQEHRHAVAYDIVVVDDTDDAGFAKATRELVAAHARVARGTIALLGTTERRSALERLARVLPTQREPVLHGLLDPAVPSAVTGSRSWNWALLLAAGGTLSILDDDTVFPLRWPDDGSELIDPADASEAGIRFFDDDGCFAAAELADEPFEWLGRWLGRSAPARVARGWNEAPLRGRPAREFEYLTSGARVVGVVPGLYGGLALDTSAYALASNSYSQASLWRAPWQPARLEADRVWHTCPNPRITSHAVYTPLLLDARDPMPFAGTWGRVDDQYFLMLLRAISAPLAFAHVPAMLGHVDLQPRRRAANARRALPVDPNLFLAHWFGRQGEALARSDRWSALAALGAAAADWVSTDAAALGDAWVEFRRGMRARVVERTTGLLDDPAAPDGWREAATALIRANREAIAEDRAADEELVRLRAGLAQVRDAAACWPAVWDACAGDAALRGALAVPVAT
jgi:hypothetical protein